VLAPLAVTAAGAQEIFAPAAEPPRLAARRAAAPITLDAELTEPDWAQAAVASGFVQADPRQGAPATRDTEVRVLFDDEALYLGVVCHDDAGWRGVRVVDLRRDFNYFDNDLFGIVFDPFLDGRNAQVFAINPYGVQLDLLTSDGGAVKDTDWNAVWAVRTRVTEDGWRAEITIPWKSLRYPAGAAQWGINFVRRVRRIDELTG